MLLWNLDNKRNVSVLSGVLDNPVWRDMIAISWREPVAQNADIKRVKLCLDSFMLVIQSSGLVYNVLGVATTVKTENYRTYQSYEAM